MKTLIVEKIGDFTLGILKTPMFPNEYYCGPIDINQQPLDNSPCNYFPDLDSCLESLVSRTEVLRRLSRREF